MNSRAADRNTVKKAWKKHEQFVRQKVYEAIISKDFDHRWDQLAFEIAADVHNLKKDGVFIEFNERLQKTFVLKSFIAWVSDIGLEQLNRLGKGQ